MFIDGHTDNAGTDKHNDQLSIDRPASVKNDLLPGEIAEDRMKSKGHGESEPLNVLNAESLTNRRVEITICGN